MRAPGWLTARPIAHRGFHDKSDGRPENTLAAFAAAIARNYAIECDLHPSSDSVPMVFHDDTLDRLTGETGPVRERTAEALGRIAVAGTSETIPQLSDLLALTAGAVPLVLELKSIAGQDAGFAASVAAALAGYGGPVAVMSFDHRLIAEFRAAAPDLPRGLTAEGDWRTTPTHLAAIRRLGTCFVSYSIADLPSPAPLIARYLLGQTLICWTVRTPAERARAARWTDQMTFEGFRP